MWKFSAAILLAVLVPSLAQAQSCALPRTLDTPEIRPIDWQNKTAKVGGYALALSWSPEYCARSAGKWRARDLHQCRDNSFGLVVHGLWPQGINTRSKEDHPRHCRAATPLSPTVLKAHLCTVPGVSLMQHQWASHGTCAFQTPEAYFQSIEKLNAVIARPDLEALQQRRGKALTVADVRNAFVSANARIGLKPDHVGVDVSNKQRLREIRICYNIRFRFAPCDRAGAPDRLPIRIKPRP
jgi:ribonuclease T2